MTDHVHILRYADIVPRPWNNGGGITRDVARTENDAGRMVWRLSIAEVASEGPFSDFTGYDRVLTVIRGQGMTLHAPDGPFPAPTGRPVSFDGATPINATLDHGPIEDFNLIHDPALCTGSVVPINSAHEDSVTAGDGETLALFCVTGTLNCAAHRLGPGDTAIIEQGTVAVAADGTALLVRLRCPGERLPLILG